MEHELDWRMADAHIQEGPHPVSPGLFTVVIINELRAARCHAELQKRYFKTYPSLSALGTAHGETGPTMYDGADSRPEWLLAQRRIIWTAAL